MAIAKSQLSALRGQLEISGSGSGLFEGFKVRTKLRALASTDNGEKNLIYADLDAFSRTFLS